MSLPDNAVPVALDLLLDVSADRAAQIAGVIARKRGADLVNLTVIGDDDREIPGPPLSCVPRSSTFRVAAIAEFPDGHTVTGVTHPIDRRDWKAHSVARYSHWQILACADLIDRFSPLTTEEAQTCRNV